MSIGKNLWTHVIAQTFLMFLFFIIFFCTYYLTNKKTTSTATFICFTFFFLITFLAYRMNYRAVPTKRQIKKYKYDREQLAIDRKAGGKTALLVIIIYLPLNIIALTISLLITYN